MLHAEHSVTIDRPSRDVFDYLADGTHNRDWRDGVIEIERVSASEGEGATYRQVLAGPGGRRIDGVYQVTVFERPSRLEFLVTAGPARPTGAFELSETPQSAGLMKLMTPMIARQMRSEVAQLDTLKAILERTVDSA